MAKANGPPGKGKSPNYDEWDPIIADLGGGKVALESSEDPDAYMYVGNELRVATGDVAAAIEALGLDLDAERVQEITGTGYSALDVRTFGSRANESVPALLDELVVGGIDAIPHHVISLTNHVQFGPKDAPADIQPGDALWNERERASRRISSASGSGSHVVVIDTGVLKKKWVPVLHGPGLGDYDKDKEPTPGKTPPYVGHGSFVAGHVLIQATDALVHVYRPDGLKASNKNDALVISDEGLARGLAGALARRANQPGNVPPGKALEVAMDAQQALEGGSGTIPKVLNLSLAGPAHTAAQDPLPESRAVLDVWHALGVLIVAAAGNNASTTPHFPAAYDIVAGVGALDRTGAIASFSNRGPWVSTFVLGEDTVSCYLEGGQGIKVEVPDPTKRPQTNGPWYGFAAWSGTSFATPTVAGWLAS